MTLGSIALGFSLFIAYVLLLPKGHTDAFYNRFVQNKQHSSIILGSSRSAQALNPNWLSEDVYNFSFTVNNSPYGPTYFNQILKVLDTNQLRTVILEINPLLFCSDTTRKKPRETETFMASQNTIGSHPNPEYLYESYQTPYFRMATNTIKNTTYLHSNGWLEVRKPFDSTKAIKRIRSKVLQYEQLFKTHLPDSGRIQSFIDLVDMVKRRGGKVVLVRIPVSPEIRQLEDMYYSELLTGLNSRLKKGPYRNIGFTKADSLPHHI